MHDLSQLIIHTLGYYDGVDDNWLVYVHSLNMLGYYGSYSQNACNNSGAVVAAQWDISFLFVSLLWPRDHSNIM